MYKVLVVYGLWPVCRVQTSNFCLTRTFLPYVFKKVLTTEGIIQTTAVDLKAKAKSN